MLFILKSSAQAMKRHCLTVRSRMIYLRGGATPMNMMLVLSAWMVSRHITVQIHCLMSLESFDFQIMSVLVEIFD